MEVKQENGSNFVREVYRLAHGPRGTVPGVEPIRGSEEYRALQRDIAAGQVECRAPQEEERPSLMVTFPRQVMQRFHEKRRRERQIQMDRIRAQLLEIYAQQLREIGDRLWELARPPPKIVISRENMARVRELRLREQEEEALARSKKKKTIIPAKMLSRACCERQREERAERARKRAERQP